MMGIVDTDISRPRKIANVDIGGPAVLVTLSPDGRRRPSRPSRAPSNWWT